MPNPTQKTINLYPVKSNSVENQSLVPGITLTDALNNLLSGSGGGNWYEDAIWIDGGTLIPLADQDGKMGTPFATFTQAITFAESYQNSLPVGPLPNQRCGTRQVFIVAGGIYDEDINILRGNTFYIFLAMGPVTLGNGLGADFASTNTRNITWLNNQAVEDADLGGAGTIRRPQLLLGTLVDYGEGSSTHTVVSCAWDISGSLILTNPGGAAQATTAELHLKNVRIRGNIDGTADDGQRNCYFYKGRIDGTVNVTRTGGALFQVIDSFRFNGLVTIGTYCRILDSDFIAGMTVSTTGNDLPPNGFENTRFTGAFTRAALGTATFTCDATTYSHFVTSGATLAGGATMVVRDRSVVPNTTGVPVDVPVTPQIRVDSATNLLWVYTGTSWKSVLLT